ITRKNIKLSRPHLNFPLRIHHLLGLTRSSCITVYHSSSTKINPSSIWCFQSRFLFHYSSL
ncbi:hypothetical protein CHARACLAT_025906, partial [Characodon lateralis]|nr:hypothetical protein [Characodon lateralis]